MNIFVPNKEGCQFCPQCGTQVSENDMVCPTCATVLKESHDKKEETPHSINIKQFHDDANGLGLVENQSSGKQEIREGARYALALFTCVIVWYFFIALTASIGWKHMGGIIPLMILFAITVAIWRGITGIGRQRDSTKIAREIMEMEQIYCIGPKCYRNEALKSEEASEQASHIFKTTEMTHCAFLIASEKVFIVYQRDRYGLPSKVRRVNVDEVNIENIRNFFAQHNS